MAKQTMKFINHLDAELTLNWIKDVVGLGIPPVDLTNTRGFRQHGYSIQYSQFQARPFTIAFDMRAENFQALALQRRAIIAFFGDGQPKTFSYTREGVEYQLTNVYLSAAFDTGIRELRQYEGVLQFVAGDPFFIRAIESETLADEAAQLEWECEYVDGGIEYSNRESAQVTIDYQGDVEAPLTVKFAGPATNPWVENTTTGAKLEVTKEIADGETLEITSGYGQKKVEIVNDSTGARANAFHYITSGSVFIQLQPGVNIITFGASAGASSAAVEISYNELYAGI